MPNLNKEKAPIAKNKYEKEFFKCPGCKFNDGQSEVTAHADGAEHYGDIKSLGVKKYIPTIEGAQRIGDVIFEESKKEGENRWHQPCIEYLAVDYKKDKKGNVVSVNFSCKACGQKFKTQI